MIQKTEYWEYKDTPYKSKSKALEAELQDQLMEFRISFGYPTWIMRSSIDYRRIIEVCKELLNETEND